MRNLSYALSLSLLSIGACGQPSATPEAATPSHTLAPRTTPVADTPVFDHIVIVIEENKDYEEIIGNPSASYINDVLKKEGASLTQMFGEEHHSEGNYFWLFSGDDQKVGFEDAIPPNPIDASNLGLQLISAGLSFKGYSEGLPAIGFTRPFSDDGLYARKHVPWISFSNVPNGTIATDSSNLRFSDFPAVPNFAALPTVSFVIPNLINDMHNGRPVVSIPAGDKWLRDKMDAYYQWAKDHNSLLILTFDENDHAGRTGGLTDPADPTPLSRNRIATIFAGAHIKAGEYDEGKGVTHVNILRTLEAMYKLKRSGLQQKKALNAGITDDFIITDIFAP